MKRILTMVILLLATVVSGMAAEPLAVQKYEGGLHYGYGLPFAQKADFNNKGCSDLGFELVYNLPKAPVALGVQGGINGIRNLLPPWWGPEDGSFLNVSLSIGAVGEYNFNRGHRYNPYAGLGVGVVKGFMVHHDSHWSSELYFRPKVGLEMFHYLRVELSALMLNKYDSYAFLTIGVRFGGLPE